MRIILNLIGKEFRQIFRNRVMLPFIFIVPVVQMVVLVYAANLEMKEITFFVVDQDLSSTSRGLTNRFFSSPFYSFVGSGFRMTEAEEKLTSEKADMVLHFPSGFEKELRKEGSSDLQILINAVNASNAGLIKNYTGNIVNAFNQELGAEWTGGNQNRIFKSINVSSVFWYNPELNYQIFMLPGIIIILISLIGMFLSALNLVREKEIGTLEQINVTPIKKYQFIIGKLSPFLVIALFELAFGLTIGRLLFDLPILGSIWLLFTFAAIYLLVVLGIGLFISTFSSTQQQVMFLAFFFMLVFILMSGIFTPVESMPYLAQKINILNPFAYFMKVIRMVLLKGSGFRDIIREFISISVYAILILALAIWRYRKIS